MTNYRLINPHIRQVSLDDRNLEVLISHVTDGITPFSCEYLQTADIELINKFKPYIIIKDGGLSKNKETIIPIGLNILDNFKIAVFDMQGDFVMRFDEDGYPPSSSVGVTNINGIGYIEIIPYHETGDWWIDQQADSTIILDDLNPYIYHEIQFICKYDYINKRSGQTLNKKNKFEYLAILSNKINTKNFISKFFIPSTYLPFSCNTDF